MAVALDLSAEEALSRFVTHMRDERRLSPKTVDAYLSDLSAFFAFLRDHLGGPVTLGAVARLEARDVRAYLARRRSGPDPLSARSLSRQVSSIRAFVRFAVRRLGVKADGLNDLRAPRFARSKPRPVSPAAARRSARQQRQATEQQRPHHHPVTRHWPAGGARRPAQCA